jgi:hypothetical protein
VTIAVPLLGALNEKLRTVGIVVVAWVKLAQKPSTGVHGGCVTISAAADAGAANHAEAVSSRTHEARCVNLFIVASCLKGTIPEAINAG